MSKIVKLSFYSILKNRKRILSNPLPFHEELFAKHGDFFKVPIGFRNEVIITRNPEVARHILQKRHKIYHKSFFQTRDLARYVGNGLLTSNGDFWRSHRKMVQPAFHKKKLEGLLSIMYHTIDEELEQLDTSGPMDVFPLMGDIAFQVVARSLFSSGDIRNRMVRLKKITIAIQEMLVRQLRQPYLGWWFHLNGDIGKHLRLSEEARAILDKIIQKRVDSGDSKDDLLDMLLNARYEDGKSMTRQQLIDEVIILFIAGHETTANALSFTLWLLAKNPSIQEKVFQEVSKLAPKGRNLDLNIVSQLTFTKSCIEESMRLYPPAYFVDRVSVEEDTIEDSLFGSGTVWLVNLYAMHRHPEYWNRPYDFVPERFDIQNGKSFSGHYFPFGAGPRMCVGNNFAMYEMMLVISHIVQRYTLTTSLQQMQLQPLITLRPQSAPITFKARTV